MKKCALWSGILALTFLLTACAGQPSVTEAPTPTATPAPVPAAFALPCYAAASLHPITGESKTNLALAPLVYQGLFGVDNHFEAVPVLARSWSVSEDGLTYTISLLPASFSDGSPLTGEDVVSSLTLAKGSALYGARLVDIKSISAEGNTVVLTLSRPRGNLPVLLDVPIVREREGELAPLGTGRYAFAGAGETLHLERSGNASGSLPSSIPLTQIQGADDLIYAFDTREISLVTTDFTGTDALGYSGGYEVWDYPTTGLLYLGFRTDTGFCKSRELRQAIGLALDRETVVTALYARHALATPLPVSPESSCYDRALAETLTYSPEAAAKPLAEGGYTLTDGVLVQGRTPVKLRLIVNTDNPFRLAAADYLAGEIEKLGVRVTVEKLSWLDYTGRLESGDFDLYLGETLLPADFDLTALLGAGGPLNYGRYADGETAALLAAFAAADPAGRPAAATALYTHLAQQAPVVPICMKSQSVLTQWGQVTGLTPSRADPFWGDGWRISGEDES